MQGLNLNGFKKVAEDKHSATMVHEKGHKIVIAKTSLKPIQLKQLEKLPLKMADGGEVEAPSEDSSPAQQQDQSSTPQNTPASQGVPAYLAPNQQDQAPPQDQSAPQDQAPAQGAVASPSTPQAFGNSGIQSAINANNQLAQAEGNQGAQQASEMEKAQGEVNKLPSISDIQQGYAKKDQDFVKYLNENEVDPNHFWKDKGTGFKVAQGIGLILGGFSSPFTGQGNPGLQILNQAIERDIDAQKSNLERNKTLYQMNHEAMKDEIGANLATRNQIYANLQNQVAKIAAQNQSPLAKARAAQLNATLQQQMDQNNFKQAIINGPTADSADPATRVQFLVPPSHQAKVFDEIGAAQNSVQSGPKILEAFDNAANKIHLADFNPFDENVDQKSMHTLLGPTFKDVEGTVRQAAMDNVFHNTTPQFGDSKRTLAVKRASLEQYLQSKSAAPTAKGFGIDLNKFPSTNIKASLPQIPVKGADGKMYVRQGQYMVPVK